MNLTNKKNLIIFASLVLAGLLWFIVTDEQNRRLAALPTQLLDTSLATHIEIMQGDATLSVEKIQGQWQLTEPLQAQANEQRIQPLLALLTIPDSTPYPIEEVDLEALGLVNPVATIRINEFEFVFGGPGPGERQRYMRIGEHVYLTRDIVLPLVTGGPDVLVAPANETQ